MEEGKEQSGKRQELRSRKKLQSCLDAIAVTKFRASAHFDLALTPCSSPLCSLLLRITDRVLPFNFEKRHRLFTVLDANGIARRERVTRVRGFRGYFADQEPSNLEARFQT